MLKFSSVLAFVLVVAAALLAVFAAAAAPSSRRPKWHELADGSYTFERYTADFAKGYRAGTAEYAMRQRLFAGALARIRRHNADGAQTWKMGVNAFTDMTPAEWKRFNGFRKGARRSMAPGKVLTGREGTPSGWAPPRAVDWRERGAVTPVTHQGSCGNCYAFSAMESMESYYYLLTGRLASLSAQQITSCTPLSNGCGGGDYAEGWAAINTSGLPLTEEWCYPYTDFFFPTSGNAPTAACYNISSKFLNKKPYDWFAELTQVGIDGYNSIAINDADAAVAALAMIGPQSISVAAGNWQWYEEGVFQNTAAAGEDNEWAIDHAVQAIGYGVDTVLVGPNSTRKEIGYWLVRNSWSTNWGEQGTIKLWRALKQNGETEPCSPMQYGPVCGTSGILSDLQYPLVKEVKPLPF